MSDDIHKKTASELFNVPPEQVSAEMRAAAKMVNFSSRTGFGSSKEDFFKKLKNAKK